MFSDICSFNNCICNDCTVCFTSGVKKGAVKAVSFLRLPHKIMLEPNALRYNARRRNSYGENGDR